VQDEDSILLSYENGTLACYDWLNDKVVEEWENFGNVKSIGVSPKSV
jgi:hypothetical protein